MLTSRNRRNLSFYGSLVSNKKLSINYPCAVVLLVVVADRIYVLTSVSYVLIGYIPSSLLVAVFNVLS